MVIIKFIQNQKTGLPLSIILPSNFCYNPFVLTPVQMKFWGLTNICHTFFQYIKKYFLTPNNTKDKKNLKIQPNKKIIKSKPRRGLYKFDPNEISSDEQSKVIKIAKVKKISKKQKFLPKINSRENFKAQLQSASTKQTFINKSGDEISSISDNEESDSIITVKQFLLNLQPSLQNTVALVTKLKSLREYQQQEQSRRMPKKMNRSIIRKEQNTMKRTNKIPIYQAQKQQIKQNQQEARSRPTQRAAQRTMQRSPFPRRQFANRFG